jgi:hypothetical protein
MSRIPQLSTTLRTALICVADHALPRLPVVLHRGSEGSMVVAGTERWSRYLVDKFFGDSQWTSERLGACPAWGLPRILSHWRPQVDLVCGRVDQFSAARFPAADFLRAPTWIRMSAPVPAPGERPRSSQARRNEQLVRRHGLTWRISRDPADLATFIERDYTPYTRLRFGGTAHLRSAGWFRSRFRHGGLIWIDRGSEPVAGVLYDVSGRSLRRLAAACVRGDGELLRIGAMSATYLACLETARTLNCDEVDLRNSRPCLTDGLVRVKQSWGGRLVPPDDVTHDFLIGWHSATPAVIRFLADAPLVVRHARGFSAVQADAPQPSPNPAPPGVDHVIVPEPGGRFGAWTTHAVPA